MSKVPVKLWWDNRHKLNRKMATSLRDEFVAQLSEAQTAIQVQKPAVGLDREEVDRRNAELLNTLKARIEEMDGIIQQLDK